jgi:uncharacterized integral membrane protein (TIGR00697 family)
MKKEQKIFVILACLFVANALIAEFIGVKIFSLESSFGFEPLSYSLFGQKMNLSFTAGVIIWPVVFVLTDIINDFYGKKAVKFLTYVAVAVIIYAFIAVNFAIKATPVQWWIDINKANGVPNSDLAFRYIFGQGQNIIVGSLVAFVIGQLLDASVFHALKTRSKNNSLWVRATVSTLVSQFIDSFVVIIIAFKIGQNWSWSQVLSVSINNYIYKGIVALLMIPILFMVHKWIEKYLGKEKSEEMRHQATVLE